MISHQLLLRAGMIDQLAAGIYSYLPLALRVMHKIEDLIREEMNAIGGQEVALPLLNPAELWRKTGRWFDIPSELIRLKDRRDREMVLAMTNEEVVTDLARKRIRSYRQLPFMIYQIKTKARDEARPRGVIRLREFTMKDGYSFHPDEDDIDRYYPSVYQAYLNIFQRCGLDILPIEAESGMIGGSQSNEFMLLSENGEDTVVICPSCGYAANLESAVSEKPSGEENEPLEIEEVYTPNARTIESLSKFLNTSPNRMLKTVMYSTGEEIVAAVIRADLDINENKLIKALNVPEIYIAEAGELERKGIVAGFVSPVGLKGVKIIADESITTGSNFVAGANKVDKHIINVNYPRDFKADIITDIASVREGDICLRCRGELELKRGIELAHIFKLGTKYSEALGATYLDSHGTEHPIVMGCYGIGVDRLMAAVIEQHHDEGGIIWPLAIAPYQIHIISLGKDEVTNKAEEIYRELQDKGYEVLFDDRDERAGVKFKDADLIGIPIRLTISSRTLKSDSVEVKLRSEKDHTLVKIEDLFCGIDKLTQ